MTAGPYRVEFTPPARRAMNQLPEKTATAAVEFCFGALRERPHRVGKPLRRELTGYHAARRGEYRVIYRIDEAAGVIHAVRVDHRGDVYRSR